MSLLSIIIPVYNVEDFLIECIESVLNQSFNEYEIILVDDGSPDNSGKICDEYEKKDKRINVIHKKNGGLSDARNAGLGVARGEYIVFLDSDDYMKNEVPLNTIMELLIKNKLDMSISPIIKTTSKSEIVDYLPIKELYRIMKRDDMYKIFSLSKTTFWGAGKNIYKRNIIMDNNIRFKKNLIGAEDCEFFMEYVRHASEYLLYNEPLIHYRINREGSITNIMSKNAILGQLRVFYDNYVEYNNTNNSNINGDLIIFFANKFANTITLIDKNISKKELEEIISFINIHKNILNYTKGLKYKIALLFWKLFGIHNGTKLLNLIRMK